MSLAGGGSVTTDQLEEQFGSVEEARSWVATVYDTTEDWMHMAAVQWNQGAEGSTQLHAAAVDCPVSGCAAHTPHNTLSHTADTLSHAQRLLLKGYMQTEVCSGAYNPEVETDWNVYVATLIRVGASLKMDQPIDHDVIVEADNDIFLLQGGWERKYHGKRIPFV